MRPRAPLSIKYIHLVATCMSRHGLWSARYCRSATITLTSSVVGGDGRHGAEVRWEGSEGPAHLR